MGSGFLIANRQDKLTKNFVQFFWKVLAEIARGRRRRYNLADVPTFSASTPPLGLLRFGGTVSGP
jgi:hypothetical protein